MSDNICTIPSHVTSFLISQIGFSNNEIATEYSTEFPNATDLVTVRLKHISGNFNDTGHISTEPVGTAVPVIAKWVYGDPTGEWSVTGQRQDVDSVLSKLVFILQIILKVDRTM